MRRTGLEYVDPIQQGIKTFATLKEIDRADAAEERAGRAETRANQELTMRQDEAGRQAATHGVNLETANLALGEKKQEVADKAAIKASAPVLAKFYTHIASKGNPKDFVLTPEEQELLKGSKVENATIANTETHKLPAQIAALESVAEGAKKLYLSGATGEIDATTQPELLEAFNLAYGPEINKGTAAGGVAGIKRAQTIYLNGDGTFSLDLAVDGPDGSYIAPLTDVRGPEGTNVRKIPMLAFAEGSKANATHGKLYAKSLQGEEAEMFLLGARASMGDTAALDALRKRAELIDTKQAEADFTRGEKAKTDKEVKAEADKVAPLVSAIVSNKKLSADEKKAQLAPILAGVSPDVAKRLHDTNSTLSSLVPAEKWSHVTTAEGVYMVNEKGEKGKRIGSAPKTAGAAGGDDSLNKAEKAKLLELDHKYNRASIAVTANQGRLKDVFQPEEKKAIQAAINADLQLMQDIETERTTFWQKKGMGTEKPKATPATAGLSGGFRLPDDRRRKGETTELDREAQARIQAIVSNPKIPQDKKNELINKVQTAAAQ